jgi:ADP-dependent NAD(P)H-hydrate dehydratase / NAD(P)H-hydrate epimerase
MNPSCSLIQSTVVTAEQMRSIESQMFRSGIPIVALMEKVGGLIARRIQSLYPNSQLTRIGILVGPGHNGGDALVVGRELFSQGYSVSLYCPFTRLKELTASHARYAQYLGIPTIENLDTFLNQCDLLVDGLFGFGLERPLAGEIAEAVASINRSAKPLISIDVPSGLQTDTGEALGTAIQATHTLCLGLWKQGLLQESALPYLGALELLDFYVPLSAISAVLGQESPVRRITPEFALSVLPLDRAPDVHKYKVGHLLVIAGSQQFMGAAILAGLGARASGVGMLSIAVPESLKSLLMSQMPDAVIIGCPETSQGTLTLSEGLKTAIHQGRYTTIACGPGLTVNATDAVHTVLDCSCPLVLDADGLNILAMRDVGPTLSNRQAPTVLTPHTGEFKRLFPNSSLDPTARLQTLKTVSQQTKSVILLKGPRTTISSPTGSVWINPDSTSALARGGSGDVLTGLLGGLLAQITRLETTSIADITASAAWWHAQAGLFAAQERTQLGVDALTLAQSLIPALRSCLE